MGATLAEDRLEANFVLVLGLCARAGENRYL
jgi:hypothetical protein